jgi:hypothetical protein
MSRQSDSSMKSTTPRAVVLAIVARADDNA